MNPSPSLSYRENALERERGEGKGGERNRGEEKGGRRREEMREGERRVSQLIVGRRERQDEVASYLVTYSDGAYAHCI